MKIALLGGTFDPVHKGHIQVAIEVLKQTSMDQVWFVPSANPPHKDHTMFSFEQRVIYIKEAIKDYPKFAIWDRDLRKNDKSYTIYLINELYEKYPEYKFAFIIGADNVTKLQSWYRYEELLELIEFIVIDRDVGDRDKWHELPYFKALRFINMPLVNVASQEIREKIEKIIKSDV